MQTPAESQPVVAPSQTPAPAPSQSPKVTVTLPEKITVTVPGPGKTTQTLTIPETAGDVEELLMQRAELSEQLTSVTARRNELSMRIGEAPEGASRTGLEARIQVLDNRIVQLETDLAVVGSRLAAAPAELVASSHENQGSPDGEFEEGMAGGVFGTLLLFPFALLYARRRWRRKNLAPKSQAPTESSQRLDRMEQGIEAIAIEIERVSEGQRFVTRLLSESQSPVGASHRIPEPVAARRDDPASR